MMPLLPISVLMTTYARDKADHLRQALESLACQTKRAAQHVLVVDGPIDRDQDAVILEFVEKLSLEVIRLAVNVGLGGALQAGLKACVQPWCARMDGDDISEPTRLEEQWKAICNDPSLDLVASWTAEFEDSPERISAYKTGPVEHSAIVRTLYWRNVVHHPTVLMRMTKLQQAGGYTTEYHLLEDYDLFLRLVAAGARMTILPKPLLRFRVSEAQRRRRGGLNYLANEIRFRHRCVVRGLTPAWVALAAVVLVAPFRLMPGFAKIWAYRFVRKQAGSGYALEHTVTNRAVPPGSPI